MTVTALMARSLNVSAYEVFRPFPVLVFQPVKCVMVNGYGMVLGQMRSAWQQLLYHTVNIYFLLSCLPLPLSLFPISISLFSSASLSGLSLSLLHLSHTPPLLSVLWFVSSVTLHCVLLCSRFITPKNNKQTATSAKTAQQDLSLSVSTIYPFLPSFYMHLSVSHTQVLYNAVVLMLREGSP